LPASEVVAINASPKPPSRTGRNRRINLGLFGIPTVAGLIGFISLIVAVVSALIAYLDWQGNVADRAATPTPSLTVPSTGSTTSSSPTPSQTPEDLSYQLSAAAVDSHTVTVTAKASGQPEPGLTYWFILEVNWGNGNIDYYPRRGMTGRSTSFDITIPANAETTYARQGRIYGLNSAQNTQAEDRLKRQGATGVDDFFEEATGQPVSNAAKLPY
jgi:hypothetical protein